MIQNKLITLIPNAKEVALKAHSMWAIYVGFAALWIPEIIFWMWGVDTNPRLWWWAGNAFLIYGAFGRMVDQGIATIKDAVDGDD